MSSFADRRRLLVSAARSDGPSVADRERIRLALAARLGGGAPPDGGTSGSSGSPAPGPSGSSEAPLAARGGAASSSGLTGMVGAIGAASVAALAVAAFLTLRPLGPSGVSSLGAVEPASDEPPRPGERAAQDASGDPGAAAQAIGRRSASKPDVRGEEAPESMGSAGSRSAVPGSARGAAPHAPSVRSPAARRGASLGPSGSTSSVGGLAEEVELLRRAREATRDGDGARALAVLDDLERRQPAGALGEERRASRIVALCASDRATEGKDAARTFLAEMPSSIHAERVRAACERGPE